MPEADRERLLRIAAEIEAARRQVYVCALGGANIQNVRRSWAERLFTWPWQPWLVTKLVISARR